MQWKKETFILSTDKTLLQIDRIHRFLSQEAYWSFNIPLDVLKKSIENSLCFGLYSQSENEALQIGYARIISDFATFAWLCDVYVEKDWRGKSLSKWIMECLVSHPDMKGLRRFCLATKDAHSLYSKYGFEITKTPENWMEIKDNNIYKKLT